MNCGLPEELRINKSTEFLDAPLPLLLLKLRVLPLVGIDFMY